MSSDMNGFPPKGGLGFITIDKDESYTNRSVTIAVIKPSGGEIDIDMAISPKGLGSLSLNIPDGAILGGNKRGANSVDLQTSRTAATQVSSGVGSFSSGTRNTSSGINSTTLGVNNISSQLASTCMGSGNISQANYATAIGRENIASGAESIASGYGANTFSIRGRSTYSAAVFGSQGDRQHSRFGLGASTTDATPTRITTDNNASASTNNIILQNNNLIYFKGEVIAKQTASTNAAVWTISGVVIRGANAASTTLVGAVVITAITNIPTFGTPTVVADTTLGGLNISVTGLAATNIRWFANVETTELIYA